MALVCGLRSSNGSSQNISDGSSTAENGDGFADTPQPVIIIFCQFLNFDVVFTLIHFFEFVSRKLQGRLRKRKL